MSPSKLRSAINHLRPTRPNRAGLKRRPTAVRILLPSEPQRESSRSRDRPPLHDVNERTPLIKVGVTPDIRRTAEDVERSRTALKSAGVGGGIGKMVELGLPLIMQVVEWLEQCGADG
jgi:hypothetical protein